MLLGVVDYTSESGTPILQNTAEILQINLAGKANLPVESMSGSGGTGRRNICLRPTEGADFYQIAKNFHTSAEMIDASHIRNQLSAAAISVKRPPGRTKLTAAESALADNAIPFKNPEATQPNKLQPT